MKYDLKGNCNDEFLEFDDYEQAKKDARIAIENYLFARKRKILLAPDIDCDGDQNEWSFRFSLPNYAFGSLTSACVFAYFYDDKIELEVNGSIMFKPEESGRLDRDALNKVVSEYNFKGSGGGTGIRITMEPKTITLNEGFIKHICDEGKLLYDRDEKNDVELAVEFMLDQLMGALYAMELKREAILSKEVKEGDVDEDFEEYDSEEDEISRAMQKKVSVDLDIECDSEEDEDEVNEVEEVRKDKDPGMDIEGLKHLMKKTKERVVGQDEYVENLAFAVYEGLNGNPRNMIVVGPTGSGKTFTVKSMQDVLKGMGKDVAFIREDCTTFTANGFKGNDVNELRKKILREVFKEKDLIIVYLDEIDKLFSAEYDGQGKNVNQDIQGELLSFLDRDSIASTEDGNRILSKRLMFICTGAFVGLDEIEAKYRKETVGVGFKTGEVRKNTKIAENVMLEQLLIEFGAIPEFIGRSNYFIRINELTKSDYYKIAMDKKHGVVQQIKAQYKKYGYSIAFRKNLIDEIVDSAFNQPVGARYIRSALARAAKNSAIAGVKSEKPINSQNKLNISKKDLA